MDRFVTRTPTWRTLNYNSMPAESLAQKNSILTKTLNQKNNQKKPLQPKQLSEVVTLKFDNRCDDLFRSNQANSENMNGNSNDSGLSSSSSISPQHGHTNADPFCTPTKNKLENLADFIDCAVEKENDTHMTIEGTPISHQKKVESGINYDKIVEVIKLLPTKAQKTQERPLQKSNNMILSRIQKDLNSPSASARLKAIKALKSPTKSAYSHFDVSETEQSLHLPEPPSLQEIMRNIVVYAEVRSGEDNRSAGVRKFIEALGARVNLSLLRDTTHVVFKDGLLSTFKKATQMGIPIVSILWIEACKNEHRICDPKDYPISNLDRYENPELYTKMKRIKSMQPDSECNKRIRAKNGGGTPKDCMPTQKTGALKKTSIPIGGTPTRSTNNKKTDITQFFKKLEKSKTNSITKIDGADCNTIIESPATQLLSRINSECYTPLNLLKEKHQLLNEIPNESENLKEQTQAESANSSKTIDKVIKVLDFQETDAAKNATEETISPKVLRKNENINTRPRRNSVIVETKADLQVSLSSRINIKPQRRHSLMPVSEIETTAESINSMTISITPKKATRRRNSLRTPKNMTIENPQIESNIETITEDTNAEENSMKFENLPKSVSRRRTLYTVAAIDQTDPMEIETKNEKDQLVIKSTRRRTIYGSKTMETSEIKNDNNDNNTVSINARQRTCYSVKSMEQTTKIIDTVKTTPTKNNKMKELINEEDVILTPNAKGNNKAINCRRTLYSPSTQRSNNNTVFSSLDCITPTNFKTGEIASSTLLDSSNKTNILITPNADAISGKLLEETEQCTTPLIFSSTRLPSNRRRTLYDVSMDIITQRLQCINQSARRTLAPPLPTSEEPTANEGVTNTLTTKNSSSTETLSESNEDKGEQTAVVATPKKSTVKKKRKLFIPNELNTPPATTEHTTSDLSSSAKKLPTDTNILTTPLNHASNNSVTKRRRTLMPISQPQITTVAIKAVTKNTNSTPGVRKRRSTLDFEQIQNIQTKNANALNNNVEPSASSSSSTQMMKSKKTPVLVYTNMHHQQIDVIREAINKLEIFHLESSVTNTTTHLVSLEPRRTLNLLRALIRGLWILNYTWISDSLDAGKWLPEEPYELNSFSRSVEICRSERQAFGVKYKCELFRQFGAFYISSHCYPINKENMQELILSCGGRVVNNRKKARYIIGDSNRILEDKVYLTPYWVLDSITRMEIMKINKYIYPLPN